MGAGVASRLFAFRHAWMASDFSTKAVRVFAKIALLSRASRVKPASAMSDLNRSSSAWTMFQGVLLIVLGVLAVAFPVPASVALEQVFAAVLLIAGGYALAAALGRGAGGTWHRILGAIWAVLTLVTGLLLVFKIIAGMLMLTILMVAYFAAQGVVTIAGALRFRGHGGFWMMLLSGVVSLLLAWVIYRELPVSAASTLGLLFGINLIFVGAYFVSMAQAIKSLRS